MTRILVLNGPNLNLLGTREPDVYGTATLGDAIRSAEDAAAASGWDIRSVQSNHEGDLVDAVQQAKDDCAAIVVNAGAYTHTSIALRDALAAVALPYAEVHVSNVYAREDFRHHSMLAAGAVVAVSGGGVAGYGFAVRRLIEKVGA